jgi:uracil DNA glycosylase
MAGELEPSWKKVLDEEFEKPYMQELKTFLLNRKASRPYHLP